MSKVSSTNMTSSNTPVESLDQDYDFFRVTGYALAPDSFGDGEHRGGAGFTRRYQILKDGVKLQTYADRHRLAPEGVFGGGAATSGRTLLYRGDEIIVVPPKANLAFQKGDVIEIQPGGGGGYGLPAKRQPQARDEDLANGMVTPQSQQVAAE